MSHKAGGGEGRRSFESGVHLTLRQLEAVDKRQVGWDVIVVSVGVARRDGYARRLFCNARVETRSPYYLINIAALDTYTHGKLK